MNTSQSFDFEQFKAPLYFITLKTVILSTMFDAFAVSGMHYVIEHKEKFKRLSHVYDPIERQEPSHIYLIQVVLMRNKMMCAKIALFCVYILVNMILGNYHYYPILQIFDQLLNSHIWFYYFDINVSHPIFENNITVQSSVMVLAFFFFVNAIFSSLSLLTIFPMVILATLILAVFIVIRSKIFSIVFKDKINEHSLFQELSLEYQYVLFSILPLFSSAIFIHKSTWFEKIKYYFWNWIFPANWSWFDLLIIL